jgi:molybdate transport system ATP-binding protein
VLSITAVKQLTAFRLNVRFESPTPGVVALFGRSGSGKSTVVNLIAGLLAADSGRITLDETVLLDTAARVDVPPEHRRLGYVFQDARLFPHLTVAANLRYAEKRAGTPYVSKEDVVGLLALGSLLDRRTHQLSGGERQRVAIGRALLSQPRLLLLDEPLAGLDDARREELLPYLETLRDQLAIPMVFVTHRFDEVLRLATHIVLMEAGAIIAEGDIGHMSLNAHLRSLIGPDEVGAIIDGTVIGVDPETRLTRVRVGDGELHVTGRGLTGATVLRIQVLARDIIVSTQLPQHLSVRNKLAGVVTSVDGDGDSDLVTIDIGATSIMARITKAATLELSLRPGMPVWALVKSVSLRGRSFAAKASYPHA